MFKPNQSLFAMLILVFMGANNLTAVTNRTRRANAVKRKVAGARKAAAQRAGARNQELKTNARDEQHFNKTIQYLVSLMPKKISEHSSPETAHFSVGMRFAVIMFFHKNLLSKTEEEINEIVDASYKDVQVSKLYAKTEQSCPERATLRKLHEAILAAYQKQQREAQA